MISIYVLQTYDTECGDREEPELFANVNAALRHLANLCDDWMEQTEHRAVLEDVHCEDGELQSLIIYKESDQTFCLAHLWRQRFDEFYINQTASTDVRVALEDRIQLSNLLRCMPFRQEEVVSNSDTDIDREYVAFEIQI
jgi:hypothetical protein